MMKTMILTVKLSFLISLFQGGNKKMPNKETANLIFLLGKLDFSQYGQFQQFYVP